MTSMIKELREKAGIGQKSLAEALGVKTGTVSVWERGISVPEMKTLKKLSSFFSVPISQLIGEETYEPLEEVAEEPARLEDILKALGSGRKVSFNISVTVTMNEGKA